jgi:hypothetical protein
MTRWFEHLKISQRLMLIGVAFIPIGGLAYQVVTRINSDAAFSQLEKYGNEYQRPLEALLQHISEHRLLTARFIAGDTTLKAEIDGRQLEVDRAFTALEAVDAKLGTDLQFTDQGLSQRKREHVRVATVKGEWGNLVASFASMDATALADAHAHLVSDVRTMITHEGDTSNLILDPDLDSYYTMDATLLALPQTQDRLANVIAFGEAILKRKTISDAERIQLAVHAAALKESDGDRVAADVQTALNEDHNFLGVSDTLQRRVPTAMREYASANDELIALCNRIVGAPQVDVDPAVFVAAGQKARAASFALWNVAADELDVLIQTRIDHHKQARLWALTLSGLGVGGSLLLAVIIARSITRQLSKTIAALTCGADELSGAAAQVFSSSQSLSAGSTEQAASLEETTASIEEMSSMTQQNAENSARAAGLMAEVDERVHASNQSLTTMVSSMERIRESSQKVSKIIKTIDEIAFQTNILALNAAVEAARAGDAGLGFAVVADEVRGLAQRSSAAAKDTAGLIAESIERTGDGSRTVQEVTEAVGAITQSVGRAKSLIDQVSLASREQAHGIEQVSQALAQMGTVTQTTTATSEETAASSEELSAQAESARALVADLRALVDGDRAGATVVRAKPRTPRSTASRPAPAF